MPNGWLGDCLSVRLRRRLRQIKRIFIFSNLGKLNLLHIIYFITSEIFPFAVLRLRETKRKTPGWQTADIKCGNGIAALAVEWSASARQDCNQFFRCTWLSSPRWLYARFDRKATGIASVPIRFGPEPLPFDLKDKFVINFCFILCSIFRY